MNLLELALTYAARGWYVFPCWPKTKKPLTTNGFKDASNDPEVIRAWWTKTPDANIAIACGKSGLTVLDVDHGLKDDAAALLWMMRNQIHTYVVRTGRRPEIGLQFYFNGSMPDVGLFELDGCSGQIKSRGGYVMAAGSIHPDTGIAYEVKNDSPIAPLPSHIASLKKPSTKTSDNVKVPKTAWTLPVHESENRTGFLLEQTGAMRNLGCGKDAILARMMELNSDPDIIADPLDEARLLSTAENCAKFPVPEQLIPPSVSIGKKLTADEIWNSFDTPKPTETDWRSHYHTFEDMRDAPEPSFLIEGFLQKDSICSIAAPVGQRKTIIAANAVHAVLTGEPLFGHFKVTERPSRVLYLCPEMGLLSFSKRMKNLGLLPYVGKTLFCRTMNSEEHLPLSKLTDEELKGALVVIDTAVRFIEGDENASEDMKLFAKDCFRLMKAGASCVLVLFHSPKGTKEVSELTLENAMRGSGDLGAFVSSCWATRLQDPDRNWESASYMTNVKQRDFESDPFEVVSDRLGRLSIVSAPSPEVKLSSKAPGTKNNADGREEEALQVIRDNPTLSQVKITAILAGKGIKRSPTWVGNKRFELLNTGCKASV